MTTTRSHLITSLTVEPGDVLFLGAGTLDTRNATVATVERQRSSQWNTITALVTFEEADEPLLAMYGGVIYHRATSAEWPCRRSPRPCANHPKA